MPGHLSFAPLGLPFNNEAGPVVVTDLSKLTPRQLAREFELDRISRDQFQHAMLSLQVELLTEAQEARKNPVTSYLNDRLSKRALNKLLRSASEAELREVLYALGDLDDFPPPGSFGMRISVIFRSLCLSACDKSPFFASLT